MCRNIKTLFNFAPPATEEEIREASLQFVRKFSGLNPPSKGNESWFLEAVDQIAHVSTSLIRSLETNTPLKSREEKALQRRKLGPQRDFLLTRWPSPASCHACLFPASY